MEEHEIDGKKAIATLPGYQMLDPDLGSTAERLTRIRGRLSPYLFGDSWQSSLGAMDEDQKRIAADTLSRNVKKAREQIATIEELRRFADRVSINTLRRWGADVGCPFPHNYSHDGSRISFGRSDYQMVAVLIPAEMRNHIGQIDFWTELQKRTVS